MAMVENWASFSQIHSPLSDLCQRSILCSIEGNTAMSWTCVMPEMRMNSLKPFAINCGPLSRIDYSYRDRRCPSGAKGVSAFL
jgi:hypothetical protein